MSVERGLLWALLALPAWGAELKPAAAVAWERYCAAMNDRMQHRAAGREPFLWLDQSPGRATRVRGGDILTEQALLPGLDVPGAAVHHWVGAVFVPGAALSGTIAILNEYERYAEFFPPHVLRSRLLARDVNHYRFAMRWRKSLYGVTGVADIEFESPLHRVDETRWYGMARSTLVREVRNAGAADERLLEPGTGNGYVWRVASMTRYVARDGGVYLELESALLSRDVPAVFRWLLNPIIRRASREALATSLRQSRDAVMRHAGCGRPDLATGVPSW